MKQEKAEEPVLPVFKSFYKTTIIIINAQINRSVKQNGKSREIYNDFVIGAKQFNEERKASSTKGTETTGKPHRKKQLLFHATYTINSRYTIALKIKTTTIKLRRNGEYLQRP